MLLIMGMAPWLGVLAHFIAGEPEEIGGMHIFPMTLNLLLAWIYILRSRKFSGRTKLRWTLLLLAWPVTFPTFILKKT